MKDILESGSKEDLEAKTKDLSDTLQKIGEAAYKQGEQVQEQPEIEKEEKEGKKESELAPDIDDSFTPTGAVTDMYSGTESAPADVMSPPQLTPLDREKLEPDAKFCISCGNRLMAYAKFCTKCGSVQA